MRRVGALFVLLCTVAGLAACGTGPAPSEPGEIYEESIEIQVSRAWSEGTVTSASADPSSSDAVAEAEILDLFYIRLEAVKEKDVAAYLSVYPASYADRLEVSDTGLTEYEKAFLDDCKAFLSALGADVSLSVEIVGRSDLSEEAMRGYRSDFKTNYSSSANITDICRLRIRCTYTGEISSQVSTDWYVAYAVDGIWYLSPENQMF